MRHFQPYSAVVTALRESSILDITDTDEIRRKTPLPSEVGKEFDSEKIKIFEDAAMPRSIYAKGFGEEGPSTQFDVEAFFAPYGPTNAIRLRRTWQDKTFKGSVFVEFDSEDTQKAFLALDPKPKFQGKELKILSKRDYVEGKAEDIKTGKIQASERPQWTKNGGGRGRGRGGRGRGDRNERRRSRSPRGDRDRDDKDWRGRRDDFQKSGDFKGRGGRRGGRGDHRGDRRDRRDEMRAAEKVATVLCSGHELEHRHDFFGDGWGLEGEAPYLLPNLIWVAALRQGREIGLDVALGLGKAPALGVVTIALGLLL